MGSATTENNEMGVESIENGVQQTEERASSSAGPARRTGNANNVVNDDAAQAAEGMPLVTFKSHGNGIYSNQFFFNFYLLRFLEVKHTFGGLWFFLF